MRTLVAALGTLAVLATPVAADVDSRQERLAGLSPTDVAASVSDLGRNVTDLSRNVVALERQAIVDDQTVITLTSDILFAFDSAEISGPATARIAELVADIPAGRLQVHGHTDSRGSADYNQQLSEDRAATVAEAIAATRPDLDLDVAGFGMTQPVAPNEQGGEDNPEGRALNRRVEIRYGT